MQKDFAPENYTFEYYNVRKINGAAADDTILDS
jgi:hypothetical protein